MSTCRAVNTINYWKDTEEKRVNITKIPYRGANGINFWIDLKDERVLTAMFTPMKREYWI